MTDANRQLAERLHPDDRIDPGKHGRPATMRRVTVNLCESPIAWLRARGHLTIRQHAAGERLRGDYERAQLGASVTMRWDGASTNARARRGAATPADLPAGAIDAKARFDGALDAAGPGLADILWRTVCAGEGMAAAEKGLGWPTRSGRLVLTLALDRVAGFYGLR